MFGWAAKQMVKRNRVFPAPWGKPHKTEKLCTGCNQVVTEKDCFPSEWRKCPDRSSCRNCTRQRALKWKQNNREKHNAYNREHAYIWNPNKYNPRPPGPPGRNLLTLSKTCRLCGSEDMCWDPIFGRPNPTTFSDQRNIKYVPKHLRELCRAHYEEVMYWWYTEIVKQRKQTKRLFTQGKISREEAEARREHFRRGPPPPNEFDQWLTIVLDKEIKRVRGEARRLRALES